MTTTILWTLILSALGISAFFILAARKRRAAKLNLHHVPSQSTPIVGTQSDTSGDLTNARAEKRLAKRGCKIALGQVKAEKDYRKLFLINVPSPARSQTYINRDTYDLIKRFLSVIAPNISISGYISNILADHMERYWSEIDGMYNEENSKPLKR